MSGGDSAETPVGRILRWVHAGHSDVGLLEAVHVLRGNPVLGASNSWGIRPNWAMETQRGLDHVQRQDSIGSKPQTTHQIDRSIRKHKIGAIFVIFVFGMEITKGG